MSSPDDLEATRVADVRQLIGESSKQRDRAYLIVLSGHNVGKMYKLSDGTTVLGRSRAADVHLDDDSVSRQHALVRLEGATIEIEDLKSSNGTLVNGDRIGVHALRDGDKIRIGETTILKFTFHDRLDESFQRRMYDAALRDPLTNIFNKKYFLDQLASELAYARRHRSPLTLVMFDLDHFKRINDVYGHVAGDEVLKELSRQVQSMLRVEDVFARYGGEEFAIILRGIDIAHAGMLSERLRATVEHAHYESAGVRMPVSISVGVAQFEEAQVQPNDLVPAADAALYAAKSAGRNCVILGPPTT